MKKKAKKSTSGKDNVIEVLNIARADELAAILQYMSQHYKLDDSDYGDPAAQVKLVAIDEMRHAEMLAERIHELDGQPVTKPSMPAKKDLKITEVFELNKELEIKAVEDYNRFMKVCTENNDGTSAKLFEQLIAEEEAHLAYFDNVLGHIEELGAVYLAKLAGGNAEASADPAKGFVAAKAGA